MIIELVIENFYGKKIERTERMENNEEKMRKKWINQDSSSSSSSIDSQCPQMKMPYCNLAQSRWTGRSQTLQLIELFWLNRWAYLACKLCRNRHQKKKQKFLLSSWPPAFFSLPTAMASVWLLSFVAMRIWLSFFFSAFSSFSLALTFFFFALSVKTEIFSGEVKIELFIALRPRLLSAT